jgi:hypothetical protein
VTLEEYRKLRGTYLTLLQSYRVIKRPAMAKVYQWHLKLLRDQWRKSQ